MGDLLQPAETTNPAASRAEKILVVFTLIGRMQGEALMSIQKNKLKGLFIRFANMAAQVRLLEPALISAVFSTQPVRRCIALAPRASMTKDSFDEPVIV